MLANLLTGMINLSMKTMRQSKITGFAIVSSYLFVLCYASHMIIEVPKVCISVTTLVPRYRSTEP